MNRPTERSMHNHARGEMAALGAFLFLGTLYPSAGFLTMCKLMSCAMLAESVLFLFYRWQEAKVLALRDEIARMKAR